MAAETLSAVLAALLENSAQASARTAMLQLHLHGSGAALRYEDDGPASKARIDLVPATYGESFLLTFSKVN